MTRTIYLVCARACAQHTCLTDTDLIAVIVILVVSVIVSILIIKFYN